MFGLSKLGYAIVRFNHRLDDFGFLCTSNMSLAWCRLGIFARQIRWDLERRRRTRRWEKIWGAR
jgi:hypothetical protein